MGYTIGTPSNNEASICLFECGMYGLWSYVMENKDDIYRNQLEFFRRGVENEDHRAEMESWYVDISNNVLEPDTWRVPYEENGNYFPEYYVIPVDAESQRDPADAYEMAEFLLHNGIKVIQTHQGQRDRRRNLQSGQPGGGYVSGQAQLRKCCSLKRRGRLGLWVP